MSASAQPHPELSSNEADRLEDEIIALGHRIGGLRYRLIRCLAEFDTAGLWALTGAVTCAHWAAQALGVTTGTAREYLRVGHALDRLTVVDAAFASGDLSWAQVRLLTRVAVDHPDRQDELVQLCRGVPAGSIGEVLARWCSQEEDDDTRDRRHDRDTALWVRIEPDGMHVITARLPPLAAAGVMAAVDATVMTTHRGSDVAGATSAPRRVVTSAARPSLARQRAGALVRLMTGGGAAVSTEVVLHVRADGCTLDDGSPIDGSVVERIAPASFLRDLIHDAESRPVNASGRQRHPYTRQRRVVKERDRHCTHPGCTSQAFLQYDHVPDFAVTGHTLVEELELRCAEHHRARHRNQQP